MDKDHFLCITYLCLFFSFLSLPFQGASQFIDRFDDGNFESDPTWEGSSEKFIINEDLQLQLVAPEAGEAYLSTTSNAIHNSIWEFSVQMDFNPSGSNYAKIYIVSDKADLAGPLNGYFVRVGGSNDAISLFKQTGNVSTEVIEGVAGRVNSEQVKAKVRVLRNATGNWELWSAVEETSDFLLEGTALDNEFFSSSYFGVACFFTSTRADKFYFDNFSVSGEAFKDLIPPQLIKIHSESSKKIKLEFSEPILASSGVNTDNYILQPAGIKPTKALIDDAVPHIIVLEFKESLQNAKSFTLHLQNIADTAGNTTLPISKSFLHFTPVKPAYRDIIVNELLVDPTPAVGMPEAEFIELYNNSEHPFNLESWQISDDKTSASLDTYLLLPDHYLILCSVSDTALFQPYGNTLGIESWASLNNEADVITLHGPGGEMIDSVSYASTWYKSTIRNQGGYSLELIDPNNPCSDEQNWKASEDFQGATPGKVNSVYAEKPDLKGPVLERVYPISPDIIELYFDENLDAGRLLQAQLLLNSTSVPGEATIGANPSVVVFKLELPLVEGETYALEVKNIFDCNGNSMNSNNSKVSFGLPKPADSLDIIINEILFNPRTDGSDFVEIYNNSTKFINLKNWKLANTAIETVEGISSEIVTNRKDMFIVDYLFAPGSFLCFASSIPKTHMYYPQSTDKPLVEISLPSYPDKEGTVVLLNNDNKPMDQFAYKEEYHSAIVTDVEGVSLERLSYTHPSQDPGNWTSSAKTNGFATPGSVNSQAKQWENFTGKITIEPKVIVPNNDGNSDFTTIRYAFDQPGFIASIYVFDQQGRLVRRIVENTSLGTSGIFTWEGVNDSNSKLGIGIYMIFFKIFHLDGTVKVYKEPVAIGNNF